MSRMERLELECLGCGAVRKVDGAPRRVDTGECPRCRYVGWAQSHEVDERVRGLLRRRPLYRRRLHAA